MPDLGTAAIVFLIALAAGLLVVEQWQLLTGERKLPPRKDYDLTDAIRWRTRK